MVKEVESSPWKRRLIKGLWIFFFFFFFLKEKRRQRRIKKKKKKPWHMWQSLQPFGRKIPEGQQFLFVFHTLEKFLASNKGMEAGDEEESYEE